MSKSSKIEEKISLSTVDKLIQNTLRNNGKPVSTYEIAKQTGISWSTANTHCYKLKSFGILDCRNEETRLGVKRIVWWIK